MGGGPPVKKVTSKRTTLVVYYILFLFVYLVKTSTLFIRLNYIYIIVSLFIDITTVVLHLLLTLRNPGIIKNEGIEFMKLLETFDACSLCPDCETIRTGRSRHCIVCNQCVDRYDHHCPWINNCIGLYNHNMFLIYLIF